MIGAKRPPFTASQANEIAATHGIVATAYDIGWSTGLTAWGYFGGCACPKQFLYKIYYGGKGDATESPAWTARSGLLLETRRLKPCDFQNADSVAQAFATASVLQADLGWKAGLPAYAVATWVAASRVQTKRHYVSDVVAGAAVGILAGRSGQLLEIHTRCAGFGQLHAGRLMRSEILADQERARLDRLLDREQLPA
mgnify:CR=1 FL=1